jgi:predicted GIY-YIG superfamily endonuclease
LFGHNVLLGRCFNVDSNKCSNKKQDNPKYLNGHGLQPYNSALLRRWLWVRAPPNPLFSASMAWVYILRGSSGRYYIGSTENLDRRLAEHRRGKVHSTRRFGEPLELITAKEMPDIDSARQLECKLKAEKNPRIALYLLGRPMD